MDNIFVAEELEGLENLYCKSSDQGQRHALEVVILNELIQIDREELKRDDQMVTEHAVVLDLDNVILIIWIVLLQVLQDAKFNTCLMLISLFVLNDLDGDNLSCLVI